MSKGGWRAFFALAAMMAMVGAAFASSMAAGRAPLARVAYESNGRIFTIAANGSGRDRLTNGVEPRRSGYGDHSPDYSPDGSRIVFSRAVKVRGSGVRTLIEIMNANGHGRHVVRSTRGTNYQFDPQWAPDGRHLAFARFKEKNHSFTSAIVVMRDDGTHRRTIERVRLGPDSENLSYVWEPIWAPNGKHLVFSDIRLDRHANYRPSLFSITRRGTGKKLVARDAGSAGFSPDGSQITFSSVRDRHGSECSSDECYFHGEIYVANADGSHAKRLTKTLADDQEPDWSADGNRIVFSSERDADRNQPLLQLFSITPGGTCRTRLTHGTPGSSVPDWEPNASLSSEPGGCP